MLSDSMKPVDLRVTFFKVVLWSGSWERTIVMHCMLYYEDMETNRLDQSLND